MHKMNCAVIRSAAKHPVSCVYLTDILLDYNLMVQVLSYENFQNYLCCYQAFAGAQILCGLCEYKCMCGQRRLDLLHMTYYNCCKACN